MIGVFISSFLALSMGESFAVGVEQSLTSLRLFQIITTLFWLLIPASLYIYLFHGRSESYLRLNKIPPLGYVILSIFLIIAIQPLVGFSAYLNEQIIFPESLSNLELLFKEWQSSAAKTIERFVADKSIVGIASNIFIIAILAAFIEEIFFRGCLQQVIGRIVKNKHLAVWVTAVIFSAVHLEFYGFLPRIFLGAILGYLFVWSGSLWPSIITHFVNNLGSIILQQIYYGTPKYQELDKFSIQNDWLYLLLSIVFSSAIIFLLLRKFKSKR